MQSRTFRNNLTVFVADMAAPFLTRRWYAERRIHDLNISIEEVAGVMPQFTPEGIDRNFSTPFEVPRENFMACKLVPDAADIQGIMEYATEFGI